VSARHTLQKALVSMDEYKDVIKDTHGNLSLRTGETMMIKPSGMPYASITAADICALDITTGLEIGNFAKPSVDAPHHLSIYRRYPHIKAVCHTHSPYATAFALAFKPIHCYGTEHADFFGRMIRVIPYSDLNEWGNNVLLDSNESAVLLERHGCLTFADSPRKAVELAVALENVAQKTHLMLQLRSDREPFDTRERTKWYDRYNGGGYGQ